MHMNQVAWLVSYPKSGNTWLRVFFSNLLQNDDKPADINNMKNCLMASSRITFDAISWMESSDMTMDEIDNIRPEIYEHLIKNISSPTFFKVHDAYTYLPDGRPLYGTAPLKVVYILRNPLDVAVSYAYHSQQSFDDAIKFMNNESACVDEKENMLTLQFRQKLLSWNKHVESWVDAPGLDLLLIKYEELKDEPINSFLKAVDFLQLPYDEAQVRKAAAFSDFKQLKKQEEEKGFLETPHGVKAFFREGKVGSWEKSLTEEQKNNIITDHYDVMKRFGYL